MGISLGKLGRNLLEAERTAPPSADEVTVEAHKSVMEQFDKIFTKAHVLRNPSPYMQYPNSNHFLLETGPIDYVNPDSKIRATATSLHLIVSTTQFNEETLKCKMLVYRANHWGLGSLCGSKKPFEIVDDSVEISKQGGYSVDCVGNHGGIEGQTFYYASIEEMCLGALSVLLNHATNRDGCDGKIESLEDTQHIYGMMGLTIEAPPDYVDWVYYPSDDGDPDYDEDEDDY